MDFVIRVSLLSDLILFHTCIIVMEFTQIPDQERYTLICNGTKWKLDVFLKVTVKCLDKVSRCKKQCI